MENTYELDTSELLRLLKKSISWSESILNSMKHDSLEYIYEHLLNRNRIYKVKISEQSYQIKMAIPKSMRIENNITYGDRFDIKFNPQKKEVYFVFKPDGLYKVKDKGQVYLPIALKNKCVIKTNDDALLVYEDGKITLKSFSYMQ